MSQEFDNDETGQQAPLQATGQVQRMAAQPVATQATTPATVLMYAMEKGADMAQIEKLMDLQLKWEANEARKAFVDAMAEFKKNPPTIIKDKFVGYENRDGTKTGYSHATLGNVTNAIVEGLARYGFSHRWDVRQEGNVAHVTCRITHRMGHSEEVSMSAGKDDSGKKNAIQQVASTITYLQRYTLLAATGLATHDQVDDDGSGAEPDVNLSEKWCAAATYARSLTELQDVWNGGMNEINDAQDREAYEQFKATCNARKAELEKRQAQPGRSSRVADIIGGKQPQQAAE